MVLSSPVAWELLSVVTSTGTLEYFKREVTAGTWGADLPVCDARLWSRPSMLQKWHGVGVALHNAKMPAF